MIFIDFTKGKKKYNLKTGRLLLICRRNRRKLRMKQFLSGCIESKGQSLSKEEAPQLLDFPTYRNTFCNLISFL